MEKNEFSVLWFCIGVLAGMLIMSLIHIGNESKIDKLKADTSYNKVKLDSIKVQVNKHDTTIYKLNIKTKEDVEKSFQLNDSASVELFKQLTTGTK